jgi:hypothetical protein
MSKKTPRDPDKPKAKRGRPTEYTKELGDEFCRRMVENDGHAATLRGICEADDMPHVATICRWKAKHAEFRELYAQALDAKIEIALSDVLPIADDGSQDWATRTTSNGQEYKVEDKEVTNRSKLRVETRFRYAGMMKPREYGPLIKQELSGANGAPLQFVVKGSEADARI